MLHQSLFALVTATLLASVSCKRSENKTPNQQPTTERALPPADAQPAPMTADAQPVPVAVMDASLPKVAEPVQFPPVIEKLRTLIEPLAALPRDGELVGERACQYKDWWNHALGIELYAAPTGVHKEWWIEVSGSLKTTIFELSRDCGEGGLGSVERNVDAAAKVLAEMAAAKMAKPVQFPPAIEKLRAVVEPLAALPHAGDLVGKRACKYKHWLDHVPAIEGHVPPPGVDNRKWVYDSGQLVKFARFLVRACKERDHSLAEEFVDGNAHVLARMATSLLEQQPSEPKK